MASSYCTNCNERFRTEEHVCPRCGGALGAVDAALLTHDDGDDELAGATLGVYFLERLLGTGGMGRVYLASHTRLARRCALKLLERERVEADALYLERFHGEGRAAAALVHRNIITVHAIGDGDRHHFLEMEHAPGGSLQAIVDRDGPCDPLRATALALGVAEGLAAAHEAGLVHRDLKPDNVLLARDGTPKIADFGLAKHVEAEGVELSGTPAYMAPELFRGEDAVPASDVYALGVLYFVLLTGRVPYAGAHFGEFVTNVMEGNPAWPDVPGAMLECVRALMAVEADERPRDAARMLASALGRTRDVDAQLREAFSDAQDIDWTGSDGCWTIDLGLPGGRRQKLFLEADDDLLTIYSVCCRADPGHYEFVLRLNSGIPHGAVAVREVDGADHFVVVNSYPRATADVEEIRASVFDVARHADSIEHRLTGNDRH
jgi:serine/threonine-protein kinase